MNRLIAALLTFFCVNTLTFGSEGEATYQSCSACHGPAAQGNEALASPRLAGQQQVYLKEQLINFRSGYRGNAGDDTHGGVMMASAQDLTDEATDDKPSLACALKVPAFRSARILLSLNNCCKDPFMRDGHFHKPMYS